ncbi:MAG: rhamnogalacturonan acetylesterase [Clostridiales bacterium]
MILEKVLKVSVALFICTSLFLSISSTTFAMSNKKSIFIVGDSTASNYSESLAPRMGWGQVFSRFFNGKVTIHNYALSGRSSKSFWDEGNFAAFVDEINSGDYLFIQFGHNDEKSYDPSRYTEAYTTYKEYLSKYIDQSRLKGANPVLLTPVSRRKYNDDGTLKQTHGEYPAAMIELSIEKNVPVIDITQESFDLFEDLGPEGTKDLFLHLNPGESPNYPDGKEDNTHFKEKGAIEVSKLILDGIKELHLPLKKYIKKCY